MSHISLYRKYRPQNFSEVLGQDAIVKSLESSLKSGNISHAYLFAGSRGTGKTSIARIFAKELGTSPNDIYEIDAASNNGVDEMRELTSGISTLPFDSKYKVYILDEVHMLSKSSFNALLKTLEEPPAHVIFILATTELHKVLDTVKSRCQVFEFKKPTIEILVGMIKEGIKKEGFKIDDEAAELIAKRGNGAFRDTWGIVERVIPASPEATQGKLITVTDVEAIMAIPHHELVTEFISALVAKNLESALSIVHKVSDEGHSMDHFIENILEHLRLVLLFRFSPQFAESVSGDLQKDVVTELKKWAGEKNIINAGLVVEFLNVLGEIKKTSMANIPVELLLMKLLTNQE